MRDCRRRNSRASATGTPADSEGARPCLSFRSSAPGAGRWSSRSLGPNSLSSRPDFTTQNHVPRTYRGNATTLPGRLHTVCVAVESIVWNRPIPYSFACFGTRPSARRTRIVQRCAGQLGVLAHSHSRPDLTFEVRALGDNSRSANPRSIQNAAR